MIKFKTSNDNKYYTGRSIYGNTVIWFTSVLANICVLDETLVCGKVNSGIRNFYMCIQGVQKVTNHLVYLK